METEITLKTRKLVIRYVQTLQEKMHVCFQQFLDLVKVIIQGGDTMQSPKVVLNSFMEAVLAITTNTKPKKNVKPFVLKKQNCHFTQLINVINPSNLGPVWATLPDGDTTKKPRLVKNSIMADVRAT